MSLFSKSTHGFGVSHVLSIRFGYHLTQLLLARSMLLQVHMAKAMSQTTAATAGFSLHTDNEGDAEVLYVSDELFY